MRLSLLLSAAALLLAGCSPVASDPGGTAGVTPLPGSDAGSGGNVGAACVTNTDCSAGPSPICLAITSTTGDCSSSCTTDSDCPGGLCLEGLIVEEDGGVASGCAAACEGTADCGNGALVCIDAACMLACQSDADCSAGTTCDASTGVCGGGGADGGSFDAGPFLVDSSAPPPPIDAAPGDAGALSGCAFATCPASVTCGSPQGSNGSYALTCVDMPPLVSGQRPSASCQLDEGSDGDFVFTFPTTYTCSSATITCDWPEGSVTCPASWLVPGDGGSMGVIGGCCGFLTDPATGPACGEADNPYCAPPQPGDMPE